MGRVFRRCISVLVLPTMLLSKSMRLIYYHNIRHSISCARRSSSSKALRNWYDIFGRSNVGYVSWILLGIIATESITGYGTDTLWNYSNRGKTYDTVDWSTFLNENQEDDEEEDDDDDE